MNNPDAGNVTTAFEQALARTPEGNYVLRLFVAGMSPRSRRAIARVKALCELHLKDRYSLEIVDVYQQPLLAKDGQIVAAPTLVRELPEPMRRLIGDMSDAQRLMLGLDIRIRPDPTPTNT